MQSRENLFSCLSRKDFIAALSVRNPLAQHKITQLVHTKVEHFTHGCALNLRLINVTRANHAPELFLIALCDRVDLLPYLLKLVNISRAICIKHQNVLASRVERPDLHRCTLALIN